MVNITILVVHGGVFAFNHEMTARMLIILIDSSTRRTSSTNKYGPSTACWCAFWDDINSPPCRVGIEFRKREAPNRIFYIGIIRALEGCLDVRDPQGKVKIMGDNDFVIKQLNKQARVDKLRPFYDEVIKKITESKLKVDFEYLSEADPIYKKVDEMAKQFWNQYRQKFPCEQQTG